eukprot:g3082.t1
MSSSSSSLVSTSSSNNNNAREGGRKKKVKKIKRKRKKKTLSTAAKMMILFDNMIDPKKMFQEKEEEEEGLRKASRTFEASLRRKEDLSQALSRAHRNVDWTSAADIDEVGEEKEERDKEEDENQEEEEGEEKTVAASATPAVVVSGRVKTKSISRRRVSVNLNGYSPSSSGVAPRQAYVNMCSSYNIRPLPSLYGKSQTTSKIGATYMSIRRCVDLGGFRLGSKQIRAVCNALQQWSTGNETRSTSFSSAVSSSATTTSAASSSLSMRTIDLSNNDIGDDGNGDAACAALCRALETGSRTSRVCRLNLSHNPKLSRAIMQLGTFFSSASASSCLHTLELKRCGLDSTAVATLVDSLILRSVRREQFKTRSRPSRRSSVSSSSRMYSNNNSKNRDARTRVAARAKTPTSAAARKNATSSFSRQNDDTATATTTYPTTADRLRGPRQQRRRRRDSMTNSAMPRKRRAGSLYAGDDADSSSTAAILRAKASSSGGGAARSHDPHRRKQMEIPLVRLDLSENALYGRGGISIARYLTHGSCRLQELKVSHCKLGYTGTRAIFESLGKARTLLHLDVSYNTLTKGPADARLHDYRKYVRGVDFSAYCSSPKSKERLDAIVAAKAEADANTKKKSRGAMGPDASAGGATPTSSTTRGGDKSALLLSTKNDSSASSSSPHASLPPSFSLECLRSAPRLRVLNLTGTNIVGAKQLGHLSALVKRVSSLTVVDLTDNQLLLLPDGTAIEHLDRPDRPRRRKVAVRYKLLPFFSSQRAGGGVDTKKSTATTTPGVYFDKQWRFLPFDYVREAFEPMDVHIYLPKRSEADDPDDGDAHASIGGSGGQIHLTDRDRKKLRKRSSMVRPKSTGPLGIRANNNQRPSSKSRPRSSRYARGAAGPVHRRVCVHCWQENPKTKEIVWQDTAVLRQLTTESSADAFRRNVLRRYHEAARVIQAFAFQVNVLHQRKLKLASSSSSSSRHYPDHREALDRILRPYFTKNSGVTKEDLPRRLLRAVEASDAAAVAGMLRVFGRRRCVEMPSNSWRQDSNDGGTSATTKEESSIGSTTPLYRDARRRSILWYASKIGDTSIVKLLVDAGTRRANGINDGDDEGNTPLHVAMREMHLEVSAYLLANGASPFARNAQGKRPFEVTTPGFADRLSVLTMSLSDRKVMFQMHRAESIAKKSKWLPQLKGIVATGSRTRLHMRKGRRHSTMKAALRASKRSASVVRDGTRDAAARNPKSSRGGRGGTAAVASGSGGFSSSRRTGRVTGGRGAPSREEITEANDRAGEFVVDAENSDLEKELYFKLFPDLKDVQSRPYVVSLMAPKGRIHYVFEIGGDTTKDGERLFARDQATTWTTLPPCRRRDSRRKVSEEDAGVLSDVLRVRLETPSSSCVRRSPVKRTFFPPVRAKLEVIRAKIGGGEDDVAPLSPPNSLTTEEEEKKKKRKKSPKKKKKKKKEAKSTGVGKSNSNGGPSSSSSSTPSAPVSSEVDNTPANSSGGPLDEFLSPKDIRTIVDDVFCVFDLKGNGTIASKDLRVALKASGVPATYEDFERTIGPFVRPWTAAKGNVGGIDLDTFLTIVADLLRADPTRNVLTVYDLSQIDISQTDPWGEYLDTSNGPRLSASSTKISYPYRTMYEQLVSRFDGVEEIAAEAHERERACKSNRGAPHLRGTRTRTTCIDGEGKGGEDSINKNIADVCGDALFVDDEAPFAERWTRQEWGDREEATEKTSVTTTTSTIEDANMLRFRYVNFVDLGARSHSAGSTRRRDATTFMRGEAFLESGLPWSSARCDSRSSRFGTRVESWLTLPRHGR